MKITFAPEQIAFPVFAEIDTKGVTVPKPLILLTVKFGELLLQLFFVTATEYVPVKLVVYVEPVDPSFQR